MDIPGKPTCLFLLTTTPPMALVAWDMLSKEKKKEERNVSDSDEEENIKNVHENDMEENNTKTPYLIPPEEQNCSCAFQIPTRSVLAKRSGKL